MGGMFFFIITWPFFLIFITVSLGIFIPCLVFAINNLKICIKKKWPAKNLIGFIICTILVISILVLDVIGTIAFLWMFGDSHSSSSNPKPTSSEAAIALCYLLSQINH